MDQLVTTVRNQQWLAMESEQKKSGLTIKVWCSEKGISENCFLSSAETSQAHRQRASSVY